MRVLGGREQGLLGDDVQGLLGGDEQGLGPPRLQRDHSSSAQLPTQNYLPEKPALGGTAVRTGVRSGLLPASAGHLSHHAGDKSGLTLFSSQEAAGAFLPLERGGTACPPLPLLGRNTPVRHQCHCHGASRGKLRAGREQSWRGSPASPPACAKEAIKKPKVPDPAQFHLHRLAL